MVCIIWQSLRGILSHILAMMSAWVWFNKYTDNESFNWQLFITCRCVWFLEMPWSFDEGICLLRLVWLMNKKCFDARLFILGGLAHLVAHVNGCAFLIFVISNQTWKAAKRLTCFKRPSGYFLLECVCMHTNSCSALVHLPWWGLHQISSGSKAPRVKASHYLSKSHTNEKLDTKCMGLQ